jgi:hypothetical protein
MRRRETSAVMGPRPHTRSSPFTDIAAALSRTPAVVPREVAMARGAGYTLVLRFGGQQA